MTDDKDPVEFWKKPDTGEGGITYTDSSKCPRCVDMYYNPKTVIEDYRQRAQEWEEQAKKEEGRSGALCDIIGAKNAYIMELKAENERLREAICKSIIIIEEDYGRCPLTLTDALKERN